MDELGIEVEEKELEEQPKKRGRKPRAEKAPEKMVRLYYTLKGKTSIIDVEESKVEHHKKAGWTE